MPPQNKIFTLSEAAYDPGSDYDVVMLYQVLLGRNPENSTVIQTHRAAPLNVALHTFVSSPEFVEAVLEPVRAGAPPRRHDGTRRPSNDQLAWLFSRSVLDESQKDALRHAADWEQFFQYLCSLEGFLDSPAPPPPRPNRIAAPFKPRARPLPTLAAPGTAPQAAPVPIVNLPEPPAAPIPPELTARLDRLEALLNELLARTAAPAHADPAVPRLRDLVAPATAVPDAADPRSALAAEAAELGPPPRPRSRRQAR